MTLPRGLRATLFALFALLVLAGPASAATITDPTGDGRDDDPGHDITRFDWGYDAASGAVTGTVTVAGPAATDAFVFMLVGTPGADGTCTTSSAVALGGYLDQNSGPGQWLTFSGGTAGAGGTNQPRSDTELTTGFAARDAQLAGKGYSCALVRLANPSDTDDTYDDATAAVTPAPAPAPAPTAAPTVAPVPTPTPAAPAAKLRATLKGVPARLRRGRTYRPRLTVRNVGTKASARMTVTVKRARGLSVRPRTVKLKALAPGKARTVRLRIGLSRRARATTTLAVTAKGGGRSATARKALRLRKQRTRPRPRPSNPLAGTFWWWNELKAEKPFNIYSLRFYDNGYAYYRLPGEDQSVPDRCTSVTAQPDEDGEFGPGCVRWSLKNGQLTFSDPRFTGTYAGGKLSMRDAEDSFDTDELEEPKAGSRLNVSYINIETSGICAPGAFCSNTKTYLTLQSDGNFGLAEETNSSFDIPGVSFVATGSYPPENRGTYTVLPGFRIRLDYADGRSLTVPFGLVQGTSTVDTETRFLLGRLAFRPITDTD